MALKDEHPQYDRADRQRRRRMKEVDTENRDNSQTPANQQTPPPCNTVMITVGSRHLGNDHGLTQGLANIGVLSGHVP